MCVQGPPLAHLGANLAPSPSEAVQFAGSAEKGLLPLTLQSRYPIDPALLFHPTMTTSGVVDSNRRY